MLPKYAEFMPHDINSCYLGALSIYLMYKYATFMCEAVEKAKEFEDQYKVKKNIYKKFKFIKFNLFFDISTA